MPTEIPMFIGMTKELETVEATVVPMHRRPDTAVIPTRPSSRRKSGRDLRVTRVVTQSRAVLRKLVEILGVHHTSKSLHSQLMWTDVEQRITVRRFDVERLHTFRCHICRISKMGNAAP